MTVHIASGLYAHVTWCTSRRIKAIRKYDVPAVVDSVLEAAQRMGVHVHAQAVLRDHVHILVSYLPTIALAPFIQHAKSESARRVNVTRKDSQRLQWARGYYVGSLSRDHVGATRSYIARQFRRHPDLIPV
ncbi:MAG: IS200/IS605 family transposase [Gemmatimonadales bacterium]